jgi:hypothetical protein
MLSEEFLSGARVRFGIVGPPVSETDIVRIFPNPFPGREDLVQFFVHQNGGSRTAQGCLVHCGNPAHRVDRDHLEAMKLEGFFSVSNDPEERMLPFAPILHHHAAIRNTFARVPEIGTFLERHRPIAFDHSGNDLWIDLETGTIRWMDWNAHRAGPVDVAPSFQEFVSRFWIDAPPPERD